MWKIEIQSGRDLTTFTRDPERDRKTLQSVKVDFIVRFDRMEIEKESEVQISIYIIMNIMYYYYYY